ncbi:MAG TPA: hypothetical protein VGI03_06745 [Verrucomicrobiae bacterium]|jgi:hypothetical protein
MMRFPVFILILALAAAGCASNAAKSQLQQRQAYLAGQNAVLQQQQNPSVTVLGDVQNNRVPWVPGLTLSQAIASANYLGNDAPKQITITRDGEKAVLGPEVLLQGKVVPLEIGDVIELEQ